MAKNYCYSHVAYQNIPTTRHKKNQRNATCVNIAQNENNKQEKIDQIIFFSSILFSISSEIPFKRKLV